MAARWLRLALALSAAAALAGCATRPVNPPLAVYDPAGGYRIERANLRAGGDPSTIMALAFSGGGTRAAAFSFGVLEELRRTSIVVDGRPRRLLDEVDFVSAVSGGSFTALGYALHGEQLFDSFDRRFLKRNVQGELIARAFSPLHWSKLMSEGFGRSEMAAEYYDEILFDGATFGDLIARDTPHAIVNGTDVSTGARFGFTQSEFDLICSDLSRVKLSRAAATSSAVPVLLTPVTFNNYAGTCGYTVPDWVQREFLNPPAGQRPPQRVVERWRETLLLTDRIRRPFLHIVDGGISDNLGLRPILAGLEALEGSDSFRGMVNMKSFRRVIVIVVNARSAARENWDQSESPPGTLSILLQAAGVPIDRYSHESLERLRDTVDRWNVQREADIVRARVFGRAAESPIELKLYAIDVSFDAIANPVERDYFMNLPTTFALPPEAIDRLRAVAGRLLRESQAYLELLRDLGETAR